MNMINVTVWNEYGDEQKEKAVAEIYPHGLHVTISEFLNKDGGIKAKTAVFSEPEHGLTDAVLDKPMFCFGGDTCTTINLTTGLLPA